MALPISGSSAKLLDQIRPHCSNEFRGYLILLEGQKIGRWIKLLRNQREGLKLLNKIYTILDKSIQNVQIFDEGLA